MYAYMYIHTHTHTHICIYIYIHTHTHTHTHTHIYDLQLTSRARRAAGHYSHAPAASPDTPAPLRARCSPLRATRRAALGRPTKKKRKTPPTTRLCAATCRSAGHRAAPRSPPPALQHTSAYVSVRQHTSTCVSIRQHTSACRGK